MTAPARRAMGELEAQVMAVLWDLGQPGTPRDVLERLPARPTVGYSAVMTVLRRLWKKGMLARRQQGKAFAYHPVQSREQATGARMLSLLEGSADPEAALAHFLGGLPDQHHRNLQRLLALARRQQ